MNNDYLFKVRTDGDIIDLEGRVIGHINNGVYCGFDREFHVDVGVCREYKEREDEIN